MRSLADLELFYQGPIPQHELEALRYGDELGREIAAVEGLVRWRRQALRRAVKTLKRVKAEPALGAHGPRVRSQYTVAHTEYRSAQAELRSLLNTRWQRKLSQGKAAPVSRPAPVTTP